MTLVRVPCEGCGQLLAIEGHNGPRTLHQAEMVEALKWRLGWTGGYCRDCTNAEEATDER